MSTEVVSNSSEHELFQLALKHEARIAQLEDGLNRIKRLADAPYAAPGVPGEPLVDAVLEWAVNEAEDALKETP